MENIYCKDCDRRVTMHADATFACECEGPIDVIENEEIPDCWYMPNADVLELSLALRKATDAERFYQSAEN